MSNNNLYGHMDEVESTIGYEFDNKDLLVQAFTRRSFAIENGGEDNEILEFIGDKVLDLMVIKTMTDRYGYFTSDDDEFDPDEDYDEFFMEEYNSEEELTEAKRKLVERKMLASRIDALGFNKYLYMGKGDIKNNIQDKESVKEDLFEAIIGAVAIDSGYNLESCEDAVKNMLNIDYYLDNEDYDEEEEDYISLIIEWSQKHYNELPIVEYQEAQRGYNCFLSLKTPRGVQTYLGQGDSKQEARWNASEYAYDELEENDELWTIQDELPEVVDFNNAINVLQELYQKGYISEPIYVLETEESVYEDGHPTWAVSCSIENPEVAYVAWAGSKKDAKKHAAYRCLQDICNLGDE